MNGVTIFFACVGVITLYLVSVALISVIFANILTDGTPDDFDYAMTAIVLLIFISIGLICDKVTGVLK